MPFTSSSLVILLFLNNPDRSWTSVQGQKLLFKKLKYFFLEVLHNIQIKNAALMYLVGKKLGFYILYIWIIRAWKELTLIFLLV